MTVPRASDVSRFMRKTFPAVEVEVSREARPLGVRVASRLPADSLLVDEIDAALYRRYGTASFVAEVEADRYDLAASALWSERESPRGAHWLITYREGGKRCTGRCSAGRRTGAAGVVSSAWATTGHTGSTS